jgi:2-oxoglutarate dehydrogenase E2 component (dihydrolipoamide succinyltransferase)
MREGNVDASQVTGTGKDGRITKYDALEAIKNLPAGSGFDVNEILAETNAFSREVEEKKMTPLRKTISKRLVASKNQTAMLTTFNEVDMKPVMDIRKKYKKKFEETHDGTRLGFMSFFMKACSIALLEIPGVNAQISPEGTHILYNKFTDISIAVSTPKGLVVPVVKNTESLGLNELENEVRRLALKGRDGKLTMEEMTGGTFTITNGGTFGSLISTPIINQPQSAILGMHAIKDRPVAIDGKVEIRPMMYLALSYDHRIIDGKESVTFLVRVKELLENPELMLFGKDPVEALLGL